MQAHFRQMGDKVGMAPGELVHVGAQRVEACTLRMITYDATSFDEITVSTPDEIPDAFQKDKVVWLHLRGLHDTRWLSVLGDRFRIHPLVMEDVLNTSQRPKMEETEEYLFVTLKRILQNPDNILKTELRQFSLILCENVLLSFQETDDPILEALEERIRRQKGRVRGFGADYLAYSIMDMLVDQSFTVLESVGEELDRLEDQIAQEATDTILHRAHAIKRGLLTMRRAIWPLREILSHFSRNDNDWFGSEMRPYIRDLYDHCIQVIESVEAQRDVASGLLDLYHSSLSNRMNRVMQVLTIIATIFIPLTFIAGIYGMNFDNMPELHWDYGYPVVMGIMLVLTGMMLWGFRRKRWI